MKVVKKGTFYLSILFGLVSCFSCKSFIPESLDALGDDINYMVKEFTPTLGRKTLYEKAVNVGNSSTLPLEFKIINVRTVEGDPATELTDKFPVKVWKASYTGEEKSLEEIEAKREIEYHSILEIGKNSGDIMFWDFGNSNWIRTQPDSCYVFDVEIANSGGRRYARNLRLKPYKERPYEPSQYNYETGLATRAALTPSQVSNLYGERTGDLIFPSDIDVFVFRHYDNTAATKTLTISVLDSMNNYIDIQKFKNTDWKNMLHGFNQRFENKKAVYDVAYPIPLITYPTRYTTADGSRARIALKFNRLGFAGLLQECMLGFDFAIYEEGHWEIQFRFRKETPKFDND